jgi:hypothetical protein
VRVMPEALERTCEMLTRAFRALKPRRK